MGKQMSAKVTKSNMDPNGDEGVQEFIQTPESRRCLGSADAQRIRTTQKMSLV
jgi:hypothetical protein